MSGYYFWMLMAWLKNVNNNNKVTSNEAGSTSSSPFYPLHHFEYVKKCTNSTLFNVYVAEQIYFSTKQPKTIFTRFIASEL